MRAVCAFDLDHTIVRSPLDLAAMRSDIQALAAREGIALPRPALGLTVGDTIAAIGAQRPELEPACWAIALEHETAALAAAVSEPGAREMLEVLAEAGVGLAVWTNNARRATELALERCALRPFFRTLVTRDEAPLKPDPAGLRLLQAAHPDRPIWVVGDSWVDGAAAQAGGATFIAYRIRPEELARRSVTAWAVVDDLRAVPAHLTADGGDA